MIAASSLAFPGSKTLALWWSQLAPFKPMQLWVGHLFIHRLEVLAEVDLAEKVDPLHLMLLRAVALEQGNDAVPPSGGSFLERLDRRLHLSPGVIARLLDDLRREGLLATTAAPQQQELLLSAPGAVLTESGRLALADGQYPKRDRQRRELVFVERLKPDGDRLQPPHFLTLSGGPGQRWQTDAGTGFELGWIGETTSQPREWQETFAFPQEIRGIADPADDRPEPPPWQRVIVDRPERLLAAIVAVGGTAGVPEKILVFAAQQDGWELRADKPIGAFAWSGRQEFPDLAAVPGWSKAWQDWCQPRQFPQAEVQACTFTLNGHRLDLHAPAALHARLLTGKSDLVKGDTWLLAGDGYVRSAANVRLQTASLPGS